MSDLTLTLAWAARAAGGTLVGGDAQRVIAGVSTDSRSVQPGELFVALHGPRFDGHQYVQAVRAAGAAGALVQRIEEGWRSTGTERAGAGASGFGLIQVRDTLGALQQMAHVLRRQAGTRVVAITGSAGKTTTKETIAAFLASRFRVVRNKGNLNNHIGLPLSLMQLQTRPDVAVMELGMNHAGEIRRLVEIAGPDVRVWTNVGDAHLGFFASPDAIADAKAEILEGAEPRSVLVCNADDPRVMARVQGFPGRTISFGLAKTATVRADGVEDRGLDGIRAHLVTPAGKASLQTPLLGRGNLENVLAATGVALEFGVALNTIVSIAGTLQPQERRGAVRRLGAITIVDDSYNSSPAALRRSLDVVAHETGARGRVAVLGEMLELGEHTVVLHEECGRVAAQSGLRALVTVGGMAARALADAAIAAGMPAAAVRHFDSSEEAADAMAGTVQPGDLILVKGSRGIRTDVVADRLVREFS